MCLLRGTDWIFRCNSRYIDSPVGKLRRCKCCHLVSVSIDNAVDSVSRHMYQMSFRLSRITIAVPTCQHFAVTNSPVDSVRGQDWSGRWNFPWDTLLFGWWKGEGWILWRWGHEYISATERRLSTTEHLNQKQRNYSMPRQASSYMRALC